MLAPRDLSGSSTTPKTQGRKGSDTSGIMSGRTRGSAQLGKLSVVPDEVDGLRRPLSESRDNGDDDDDGDLSKNKESQVVLGQL
jgi:hypothetical protein